jgi:GH24 family phage-related lysozyme (muramidase)
MTIRLVAAQHRIQWDTFTVQNTFAVQLLVNTGVAIISEPMIDFILSHKTWSGVRYQNSAGEYEIGYGIGDPDNAQGNTESQSYAEWIGFVRNEQKKLQAQLPVIGISQATFDALLSLYLDTGTWRTVVADEGTYDLADAIKNGNWLLAADIISRGNINPNIRKAEARIMQLGDYSSSKDRNQQIIQGVQRLRKRYVNGLSNESDKRQAEFVYYRQLGAFLPGMSQLRQRRVIAQALS